MYRENWEQRVWSTMDWFFDFFWNWFQTWHNSPLWTCLQMLPSLFVLSSKILTFSEIICTVKIFYSVAPSNPLFVDKLAIQVTSNPLFWDKDWPNFGLSNSLSLDKKWPELPGSSLDSDASCIVRYPSEDRHITQGGIEGKLYNILSKLMSPSLWYAQLVSS